MNNDIKELKEQLDILSVNLANDVSAGFTYLPFYDISKGDSTLTKSGDFIYNGILEKLPLVLDNLINGEQCSVSDILSELSGKNQFLKSFDKEFDKSLSDKDKKQLQERIEKISLGKIDDEELVLLFGKKEGNPKRVDSLYLAYANDDHRLVPNKKLADIESEFLAKVILYKTLKKIQNEKGFKDIKLNRDDIKSLLLVNSKIVASNTVGSVTSVKPEDIVKQRKENKGTKLSEVVNRFKFGDTDRMNSLLEKIYGIKNINLDKKYGNNPPIHFLKKSSKPFVANGCVIMNITQEQYDHLDKITKQLNDGSKNFEEIIAMMDVGEGKTYLCNLIKSIFGHSSKKEDLIKDENGKAVGFYLPENEKKININKSISDDLGIPEGDYTLPSIPLNVVKQNKQIVSFSLKDNVEIDSPEKAKDIFEKKIKEAIEKIKSKDEKIIIVLDEFYQQKEFIKKAYRDLMPKYSEHCIPLIVSATPNKLTMELEGNSKENRKKLNKIEETVNDQKTCILNEKLKIKNIKENTEEEHDSFDVKAFKFFIDNELSNTKNGKIQGIFPDSDISSIMNSTKHSISENTVQQELRNSLFDKCKESGIELVMFGSEVYELQKTSKMFKSIGDENSIREIIAKHNKDADAGKTKILMLYDKANSIGGDFGDVSKGNVVQQSVICNTIPSFDEYKQYTARFRRNKYSGIPNDENCLYNFVIGENAKSKDIFEKDGRTLLLKRMEERENKINNTDTFYVFTIKTFDLFKKCCNEVNKNIDINIPNGDGDIDNVVNYFLSDDFRKIIGSDEFRKASSYKLFNANYNIFSENASRIAKDASLYEQALTAKIKRLQLDKKRVGLDSEMFKNFKKETFKLKVIRDFLKDNKNLMVEPDIFKKKIDDIIRKNPKYESDKNSLFGESIDISSELFKYFSNTLSVNKSIGNYEKIYSDKIKKQEEEKKAFKANLLKSLAEIKKDEQVYPMIFKQYFNVLISEISKDLEILSKTGKKYKDEECEGIRSKINNLYHSLEKIVKDSYFKNDDKKVFNDICFDFLKDVEKKYLSPNLENNLKCSYDIIKGVVISLSNDNEVANRVLQDKCDLLKDFTSFVKDYDNGCFCGFEIKNIFDISNNSYSNKNISGPYIGIINTFIKEKIDNPGGRDDDSNRKNINSLKLFGSIFGIEVDKFIDEKNSVNSKEDKQQVFGENTDKPSDEENNKEDSSHSEENSLDNVSPVASGELSINNELEQKSLEKLDGISQEIDDEVSLRAEAVAEQNVSDTTPELLNKTSSLSETSNSVEEDSQSLQSIVNKNDIAGLSAGKSQLISTREQSSTVAGESIVSDPSDFSHVSDSSLKKSELSSSEKSSSQSPHMNDGAELIIQKEIKENRLSDGIGASVSSSINASIVSNDTESLLLKGLKDDFAKNVQDKDGIVEVENSETSVKGGYNGGTQSLNPSDSGGVYLGGESVIQKQKSETMGPGSEVLKPQEEPKLVSTTTRSGMSKLNEKSNIVSSQSSSVNPSIGKDLKSCIYQNRDGVVANQVKLNVNGQNVSFSIFPNTFDGDKEKINKLVGTLEEADKSNDDVLKKNVFEDVLDKFKFRQEGYSEEQKSNIVYDDITPAVKTICNTNDVFGSRNITVVTNGKFSDRIMNLEVEKGLFIQVGFGENGLLDTNKVVCYKEEDGIRIEIDTNNLTLQQKQSIINTSIESRISNSSPVTTREGLRETIIKGDSLLTSLLKRDTFPVLQRNPPLVGVGENLKVAIERSEKERKEKEQQVVTPTKIHHDKNPTNSSSLLMV